MELPFELRNYHKVHTLHNWKRKGFKETNEKINEIYEKYIRSSKCELCGKVFESSKDRQMDHNHETGKFRNIVCNKCNHNRKDNKSFSNTGFRWICKIENKRYKQGFCFINNIQRNGKNIFYRKRKTLEQAIKVRDKFIEENPDLFT